MGRAEGTSHNIGYASFTFILAYLKRCQLNISLRGEDFIIDPKKNDRREIHFYVRPVVISQADSVLSDSLCHTTWRQRPALLQPERP